MGYRNGTRGFTLVELLVVIGIIAVLIGILLPALNRARQSAQLTQCMSNLHQWGIGFQMYVDQNKGLLPMKPPDGTTSQPFAPSSGMIPGVKWPAGIDDMSLYFNAIPSMIGGKSYYQMILDDKNGVNRLPGPGSNNLFVCPAAQSPNIIPGSGDALSSDPNFYAFSGSDSSGQLISPAGSIGTFKANINYVYSSNLLDSVSPTTTNPATPFYYQGKMSQCRPAAAVVVMMEKIASPGEYLDPGVRTWCAANGWLGTKSMNGTQGYTAGIAQLKANWKRFAARHNGGGSMLFADGHVSFYKWPEVQLFVKPNPVPSGKPGTVFGDQYNANRPDMIWNINGPCN